MRLIDADALKDKLLKERDAIPVTCTERYGFGVEFPNHHGQSMRGGIKKALRCMEQTPTIDAVPVVRCKDCECFMEYTKEHAQSVEGADGDCYIRVMNSDDRQFCGVRYIDFCSYGERKDGE